MRKIYNKLIRDRIPEIIEQSGRSYEIATYTTVEYHQALKKKLIEEAQEIAQVNEEHLLEELADLYEVIDALITVYKIDVAKIKAIQAHKRDVRGAFHDRIKLCWTE
jgi:predicted house-cleaning noncanonical NTP pyrophosphatase (MazG superfamily)